MSSYKESSIIASIPNQSETINEVSIPSSSDGINTSDNEIFPISCESVLTTPDLQFPAMTLSPEQEQSQEQRQEQVQPQPHQKSEEFTNWVITCVKSYSSNVVSRMTNVTQVLGSLLRKEERQILSHETIDMANILSAWKLIDNNELDRTRHHKLVVAVMGRVSSGKSALMKALLQIPPERTDILEVSALSGTTRNAQAFLLRVRQNDFLLLDFPGFQEVYGERACDAENFERIMKTFLCYGGIDVGIYVVNGAADNSQKADFDRIARYARKMFLVRTKADELDLYNERCKEMVVDQWKVKLGVDKVYLTKVLGYDPASLDYPHGLVDGVDILRADMCAYLARQNNSWGLDVIRNGVLNLVDDQTVTILTASAAILIGAMKLLR